MIKHIRNALSVLALLLTAPLADAAEVHYSGTLVVTKVANCAFTRPGFTLQAAFRPPGVGGNTNGGLGLFTTNDGYAINFGDSLPALGVKTKVDTSNSGQFGFSTYPAAITITKLSPSPIKPTTRSVYMEATLIDPFGEKFSPGQCNVDVRASFVLRFPADQ